MANAKLRIELNKYDMKSDKIFVCVGIGGGFATKRYSTNTGETFELNLALFNVLFNYMRKHINISAIKYDVQRTVSLVSFTSKQENVLDDLSKLLMPLSDFKCSEENFLEAKEDTIKAFEQQFKHGSFRALFKSFEFADLNKRFLLKDLISDIESIEYDDFIITVNRIVNPNNICIYVLGKTTELDNTQFEKIASNFKNHDTPITFWEEGYDPYLKQDASIVRLAKENYNLTVLTFDFLSKNLTTFSKKIILDIFSECLNACTIKDIHVDAVDASIILETETIEPMKSNLFSILESSYSVAKKKCVERYAILIECYPDIFACEATSLMLTGIYIDQYIDFLNKCTYALFDEIIKNADIKISEAQIVLRKEKK